MLWSVCQLWQRHLSCTVLSMLLSSNTKALSSVTRSVCWSIQCIYCMSQACTSYHLPCVPFTKRAGQEDTASPSPLDWVCRLGECPPSSSSLGDAYLSVCLSPPQTQALSLPPPSARGGKVEAPSDTGQRRNLLAAKQESKQEDRKMRSAVRRVKKKAKFGGRKYRVQMCALSISSPICLFLAMPVSGQEHLLDCCCRSVRWTTVNFEVSWHSFSRRYANVSHVWGLPKLTCDNQTFIVIQDFSNKTRHNQFRID